MRHKHKVCNYIYSLYCNFNKEYINDKNDWVKKALKLQHHSFDILSCLWKRFKIKKEGYLEGKVWGNTENGSARKTRIGLEKIVIFHFSLHNALTMTPYSNHPIVSDWMRIVDIMLQFQYSLRIGKMKLFYAPFDAFATFIKLT